ncbi:MAG: serine/threonine-protein kinase, partial [Acidimicrobiales bacterium]
AARLTHPVIVATYDAGADGGTSFSVMELVEGPTLRELVAGNGALPPVVAVNLAAQMAEALGHAHRVGLVHRDVKPANVLLSTDEAGHLRAKVTDFGIAKATEALEVDLTRTGMVLGTPKYLSPEQVKGVEPDPRSDLYALGVVLHEMLTGSAPFRGPTEMATAIAHLHDPPPRLAGLCPGILPALEDLVAALLAKQPEQRPQSAAAVRESLGVVDGQLRMDDRASGQSRPACAGAGRDGSRGWATPPPLGVLARAPGGPHELAGGGTSAFGVRARTVGTSTAIAGAVGQSTDVLGRTTAPAPAPVVAQKGRARGAKRRRHPGRGVGLVVGVLALMAAVTAVLLVSDPDSPSSTPPAGGIGVTAASVFMVNDRSPDDPAGAKFAVDGNPSTAWQTAIYSSADFGGLYPGIGLSLDLGGAKTLRELQVVSPSDGWSAEVFVARSGVGSPSPLAAWGSPIAARSNLHAGAATLALGGHRGGAVLLWLTNLGPARQVSITELVVR